MPARRTRNACPVAVQMALFCGHAKNVVGAIIISVSRMMKMGITAINVSSTWAGTQLVRKQYEKCAPVLTHLSVYCP